MKIRIRAAARAAAFHLLLSSVLVGSTAAIIFFAWFSGPYLHLFNGIRIFWIALIVDLVCGPLMTLIVYNPAKSRRELSFDLMSIGVLQLAALGYAIHIASLSRPVALVYEVDRFVAVSRAEVDDTKLYLAPGEAKNLPIFSAPHLLAIRPPKDGEEMLKSIELSLGGAEPSVRPDWWRTYAEAQSDVLVRMKSLGDLDAHLKDSARQALRDAIGNLPRAREAAYYLPLTSRKNLDDWIVVLNARGELLGFAPAPGWND